MTTDQAPTTSTARVEAPAVSIVVPTLNEARNLPHILLRLPADAEVVLVDGHSTDGTVDVARSLRPDIVVVCQTRRGKGNALACGFAAATGDIIVMLDADGSADPTEIADFVHVLRSGADFAKGSRFLPGGGSSDITPLRRTGNLALSGLVNGLLRSRYSDLCYGYNAFWRHVLPALDVEPGAPGTPGQWGDGFEIETLITMRVAHAGLRVVEVPSFEHPRIHGTSNLNAASDGLRVLRTIMVEWGRRSGTPRPRTDVTLPAPRPRRPWTASHGGARIPAPRHTPSYGWAARSGLGRA
ncbi:glycosyltransferase family 2 protein [Frankia sp. Cpl3]|uniref:glycosyltransferase family 2 protein n=1 Tax=Parafrankia colletiae TaxID=573497 RepID=UPI0009FC6272|nr:glycosyltransferase family 2 protein [Parafrankia colletiae]MCK9901043.1 glycosyltransferase family 2 protein [Frankia sp. Cpl3]